MASRQAPPDERRVTPGCGTGTASGGRVERVTNLPALLHVPHLVVVQQKEMLEIFTDFETRNRYAIRSPEGQVVLFAAELGGSLLASVARHFFKSRRPFKIQLMRPDGGVQLTLVRPWTWFFSELHVRDEQGRALGSIDQRFSVLHRRFAIKDAAGVEIAEIRGPLFRPWTFQILIGGVFAGKIAKRWSGLLKESFTDADTFGVEFGTSMTPELRSLVLAATFLIDFVFFES